MGIEEITYNDPASACLLIDSGSLVDGLPVEDVGKKYGLNIFQVYNGGLTSKPQGRVLKAGTEVLVKGRLGDVRKFLEASWRS